MASLRDPRGSILNTSGTIDWPKILMLDLSIP